MGVVKLLDTKQVAKKFRVTERRVRAWCEEKRLGVLVAGRWVISEAELSAFKPKPTGRPKERKKK